MKAVPEPSFRRPAHSRQAHAISKVRGGKFTFAPARLCLCAAGTRSTGVNIACGAWRHYGEILLMVRAAYAYSRGHHPSGSARQCNTSESFHFAAPACALIARRLRSCVPVRQISSRFLNNCCIGVSEGSNIKIGSIVSRRMVTARGFTA